MDGYDESFHTYDEEDFEPDSSGRRSKRRKRKGKSRWRDRLSGRRAGGGDDDDGGSLAGHSSHDAPFSDLKVVGNPCRIHRDDALASDIDNGKHLVDLFEGAMGFGGDDDFGYGGVTG
uniref:Uncharacterized protein n=1 Tax=Odontella aurita TaxID=265563 RepID=A0A7S4MVY1_9STRA|mmetsp:Transcript_35735/g.106641  ORF Transcript_35735/g.106641 Transcript_35735/m.106641 type:complete len:118 (+) Transcript_35735:55-408(+)